MVQKMAIGLTSPMPVFQELMLSSFMHSHHHDLVCGQKLLKIKYLKFLFGCIRLPLVPSSYIFYEMDPQNERKEYLQMKILMVSFSVMLLNKISNSLLVS